MFTFVSIIIQGLAMNVKQYDIIGLMIDPANNFHFFLNKLPLYIAKNIPRPCYMVFDLDINIKKVSFTQNISTRNS